MPSAFEMVLSGALTRMYSSFGVPGVYTGANNSSVSGTIRIHRNESSQVVSDTKVATENQTAEIFCRQSEFAKPARGGRFLVDGKEIWTVEKMPLLKNGQWTVYCVRTGTEREMERKINA